MKRVFTMGSAMLVAFLLLSTYGFAQQSYRVPGGTVIIPKSSMNQGPHRAHTNFQIFVSDVWHGNSSPPPNAETPASLACVYKLVHQVSGCPISGTTQNPAGGSRVVAIVDAYDNPDAEADLAAYSTQFGLPACTKDNGSLTERAHPTFLRCEMFADCFAVLAALVSTARPFNCSAKQTPASGR